MAKSRRNKPNNGKGSGQSGQAQSRSSKPKGQGGQPRKDSTTPRVNFDNARESKFEEDIKRDMKSGKYNDIAWYVKNPELAAAAASMPMVPILGRPFSGFREVPGLLTYYWEPAFGPAATGQVKRGDPNSSITMSPPPTALQMCADSTYSFLVHANSRNYSYNSSDLMILILAGMNVFSAIKSMIRAYGLAKYYEATNAYLPQVLVTAAGFDFSNLQNNLGKAWFDLNRLIERTREIWIPDVFPILERWQWLNSGVYADAEGNYSQLYMMVQDKFFMYSEVSYEQGGCLIPAQLYGIGGPPVMPEPSKTTVDWDVWVRMVDSMINALVDAEDRGLSYGDLLNAYGADHIYALSPIPADFTIAPAYSPEVLMQIENTVIMPMHLQALVQYENGLYPVYQSSATINTKLTPNISLLNFHFSGQPNSDAIIEATRNKCQGYVSVKYPQLPKSGTKLSLGNTVVPQAVGSEIFTGYRIWVGQSRLPSLNSTQYSTQDRCSGDLMAFDWHHFTYEMPTTTPDGSTPPDTITDEMVEDNTTFGVHPVAAYGDYDHYGVIHNDELADIHSMCMLSLFDVPQI